MIEDQHMPKKFRSQQKFIHQKEKSQQITASLAFSLAGTAIKLLVAGYFLDGIAT